MSNNPSSSALRKNPQAQRVNILAKLRGNAPSNNDSTGVATTADVATRDLLKAVPDESTVILHVDQIEPDPNQPRDDFDSEETKAYLGELAADIKDNGQTYPIVVEPLDNNRYKLMDGECRWRAIKFYNNDTTIRATIRALVGDDARRDLIQLNSNEQRRGFTKLQLAHTYQKLQERYGWNDAELARQVNKNRQYVSAVKKVLAAPVEIQDALKDGRLSWRDFVNNNVEVMRDHAAGAFSAEAKSAKRSTTKNSARNDEQSEPNVSIPQSVANQIFLHMQDLIEDKKLNIEIPKNPTRRQLGEFIGKHFRKVRRASA
jgi:ParB/RepB/Spo0J family partition protein